MIIIKDDDDNVTDAFILLQAAEAKPKKKRAKLPTPPLSQDGSVASEDTVVAEAASKAASEVKPADPLALDNFRHGIYGP